LVLLVASEIALAGATIIAQKQNRLPHLDPVTCGTESSSKAIMAAAQAANSPIEHVVIIFGENISFGHYFGTLSRLPLVSVYWLFTFYEMPTAQRPTLSMMRRMLLA
jgi:hypothetical protein